MTKKDNLHVKVVPYESVGEARVGFYLFIYLPNYFLLNSILLIKSMKQRLHWKFNSL